MQFFQCILSNTYTTEQLANNKGTDHLGDLDTDGRIC